MASKYDIAEGTRVSAPHPKHDGERQEGVVLNNLSVMYFIKFDDGTSEFLFKAEDVRQLEA